ncbi:MAG: ABC transporter ATP-binding protein [Acholeplasmatales bacterium]|nr:ABC transporter ATP-binding protein [Acholeplasmatales bacterium]
MVVIKRLLSYIKPYRVMFIVALIMILFTVAMELIPAVIQGSVIGILSLDVFSENNDANLMNIANYYINNYGITLKEFKLYSSFIIIGSYIFVIVLNGFITYKGIMILQRIGQSIVRKLREEAFVHIESLSISQINKNPIGKYVTRVTSDMNKINLLYSDVIVKLFKAIISIIVISIVMIFISPILSLYVLLVSPFLVLLSYFFNKLSRKKFRLVRGSVSNINAYLNENLSGMKVIQVFNQEEKKVKEFNTKNNELKKNYISQILVFSIFRPLIYFLYLLTRIIVLIRGIYLIKENRLSITSTVSFYNYVSSLFDPIQKLADLFQTMQNGFASAERIFELLDTKIEIEDSSDAIEVDRFKGKIEFRNVWFAYIGDEYILKNVSFVINPNEVVAFVGATGAGKSTILSLITRNYEINSGEILIDDIPIRKIKIECLRKHIGQMLQDVFLFSGTIKDNITLRDDSFSDEEISEATKYVNCDRLIDRLDGKLDYMVLERGSNFSAGERQLISFARTIITKPNILILDEATANIDTETEVLIQDSLNKMMSVGTMLIVAHRLSTIQHADNIIVLNKGEIVESGNHQELLKRHGIYYNLYELQYKHMEK